jgi:hypothetical protein
VDLRNVVSTAAEPLTDEATSPLRHLIPLRVGDPVPEVASFVDQRGRPFRFATLRGQDVVLAFIYTRCEDARMCPLISATFRALQDRAEHRALHLARGVDRPGLRPPAGAPPLRPDLRPRPAPLDTRRRRRRPVAAMRTDTAWTPDELPAQIDVLDGHGGNALQRFDLWLKTGAIALCGNAVAGFSGVADLFAAVVILAAFVYLLYRLARKRIFLENA